MQKKGEVVIAYAIGEEGHFINLTLPHGQILTGIQQVFLGPNDLPNNLALTNKGWATVAQLLQGCPGARVCVCEWQDFFCITNQCHSFCVAGPLTVNQIVKVLHSILFSDSVPVIREIGDVAFCCAKCKKRERLFGA